MRNKQQLILFLTNLILFFTGSGIFPLLPGYATQFGTSQTMIGIFLASLSATNAVGAIVASRLLVRFAPRTLFIVAGTVGVPTLLFLPAVHAFWLVVVITGFLWFSGGMLVALMSVLIGQAVEPEVRGRAFSRLFLASPLGAILGGTLVGAVVTSFGYTPAFLMLGVQWAVIPALGFLLQRTERKETRQAGSIAARPAALGPSFRLFMVSVLAIMAAIQMGNVSLLLQMQAGGFSASAISTTTVVSGLVSIPVALYGGSLADRVGRRLILVLGSLLAILTLAPLASASQLWHFSAAISLLLLATTVVRPGSTALATDLLDSRGVARGLPLLEAGIMTVGVAGSTGAGYVLEIFGSSALSLLTTTLAATGGLILLFVCLQCAAGRPRLTLGLRSLKRT